ncbi:MAG: xanthine dehydrogenase family protein subunit M [Anaerolineaceae bacterium]|nr:xanthine dehydrogenase family protein subunit M [Anaerolineaceae bacterium]
MKAFTYVAPRSVAEVTTLLSQNGSQIKLLAGGTDLLTQIRENRRTVDVVVDVKHIPELNQLSFDPVQGLTIGAAVPCFKIWNNPTVASLYPGLTEAVALIGGIQIQGRATLGGNLVNASPAADSIPALIVHHATCNIAGSHGIRSVPVENFCRAPGQTILQKDELLVSLHLKPPVSGFGAHYLRFIPRNEMDIAVVGAGASVTLDAARTHFQSARVALGAVAPIPLLIPEISAHLAGKAISIDVIDEAAQIAAQAVTPISDVRGTVEQRKHLAKVLTRRALLGACERAGHHFEENR